MKNFRLITGNRLERLSEILSQSLKSSVSSPLAPEIFVVQSQGMSRWITMEIAKHLGISANLKFYYPNDFIQFAFNQIVPDFSESSLNDKEIVTWKLMEMIPQFAADKKIQKIGKYLEDDVAGIKKYQLARRLADTFDQYLLFRPEMILDWEAGKENTWQAEIWRKMVTDDPGNHRAKLLQRIQEHCRKIQHLPLDFPERVSIFGISALPRFHMELFEILSHFIQVNLFLLNPCQEYWGDILSNKEVLKQTRQKDDTGIPRELLYLDQGNTLLAAMGAMGRDFFDMINAFGCEEIEVFEEPGNETLIQHIQTDILNLKANPSSKKEKQPLLETDRSVSIHACHSPMRELEVLHNHLLSLFEDDDSLSPTEILVMTPDIETYAPYIDAIFNLPREDKRWLPYSIADRSMLHESNIIKTFFAILDLSGSRFRLTDVMPILESLAVQSKFELSEGDLQLIQKWIGETRIQWGIDSDHKEKIGLPGIHENTWKAGIQRLLLGYAMAGKDEKTFGDILPYDHIEGSSAFVVGKFAEFIHQLISLVESMQKPKTLKDWISVLENLLKTFFQPEDNQEREIQALREFLNNLEKKSILSDFHQPTSIEVVKTYLSEIMGSKGFGTGFISGGITFSSMLPMRSIPFKVICLLGMNHDAYPRHTNTNEFNLISQNPRPGDRSRRHDDQYLLLESILSVRKALYISFIGKNIRDNSSMPPSVLVSELLQYIEDGYVVKNRPIREHVVIEHKLQPFHPVYFDSSKKNAMQDVFYSYSEQDLQGAQCIQGSRKHPDSFFSKGLSVPEEEWKDIDLNHMHQFFKNPSKYILNNRLGIFLDQGNTALNDRESFKMNHLDQYLLSQNLVKQNIHEKNTTASLKQTRTAGILPMGKMGDAVYEGIHDSTTIFTQKLKQFVKDGKRSPFRVDLPLAGFTIKGKIDSLYTEKAIYYRYGLIGPKDLLSAWLNHLLLNHPKADNCPRESLVAGLSGKSMKDAVWIEYLFHPIDNAEEIIEQLIAKYWEGLITPLKFFPKTSYQYAEMILIKNFQKEDALKRAENVFAGNDFSQGEIDDPYSSICFKNRFPLDEAFEQSALDIFQPMLEHLETTKSL